MTRSLTLAVLLLLSTIASAQQPGFLTISLPPFEYIGESDIARGFATVRNDTGADIRDALVSVQMHAAPTVFLGGEGCVNFETPDVVHCAMPLIRAGESIPLQLYIGPIREARVYLMAQVHAKNTPPVSAVRRTVSFPRDFVVTNTGDAGPGSLRDAIERVNRDCLGYGLPCRIAFHIDQPVPASGWHRILLNSPLPEIVTSDVEIDGATQTQFGGDTNPLGPEITLDGSGLGIGHGLVLTGSGFVSVTNLAIGGFPWDGIAVLREGFSGSAIADNYIGTDASGTKALPNRSRGITFNRTPSDNRPSSNFEVRHNLISDNVRAGVFAASAYNLLLLENTIRANSAGIFLGPETHDVRVERNAIVENAQFGVAIAPATARYNLVDNSITRNGLMGIDRGLDGSGYEPDSRDTIRAYVEPPQLVSAHYDPSANTTTIAGTYLDAGVPYSLWELTLFRNTANDGQGEAVIGHTTAPNGMFSLTVPGDLRGQFITATGQHTLIVDIGTYYWTSEFSEAIEVR